MEENMILPNEFCKNGAKYPFAGMLLADTNILDEIIGRSPCIKCGKSRKFFCYTCCIPVKELMTKLPNVHIPVKIDVIKHKHEIDGKSTAIHSAILTKGNVNIYTYPDIPDYSKEDGVVLIFPSPTSVNISSLFGGSYELDIKENFGLPKGFHMGTLLKLPLRDIVQDEENMNNEQKLHEEKIINSEYNLENLPVKRAVFIDSTWNQCRGIYKDKNISSLKCVVLQNRISQFWRHQEGSPRWYLSTIEAIHQFLLEVHINAWGINANYRGLDHLELKKDFILKEKIIERDNSDLELYSPYNGQYDNLLFFFAHMFNLIHQHYDHNDLKSYKRPFI